MLGYDEDLLFEYLCPVLLTVGVSRNFKVPYVVFSEKNKRSRKRSRLQSSHLVQRAVDRMVNKIFGSKAENLGLKPVALFGNGTLRSMRGHAAAQRKKLVKVLTSRGAVCIVNEYCTSKRCPGVCAGDIMVDTAGIRRFQRGSTPGRMDVESPCSLFNSSTQLLRFTSDGDSSAATNFLRIRVT